MLQGTHLNTSHYYYYSCPCLNFFYSLGQASCPPFPLSVTVTTGSTTPYYRRHHFSIHHIQRKGYHRKHQTTTTVDILSMHHISVRDMELQELPQNIILYLTQLQYTSNLCTDNFRKNYTYTTVETSSMHHISILVTIGSTKPYYSTPFQVYITLVYSRGYKKRATSGKFYLTFNEGKT